MAIVVKAASQAAQKFVNRASVAGEEYKAGVVAAGAKQMQNAIAANPNWKQAVTQAVSTDAYAKGLTAAGPQKWAQKASTKGATNYPGGVSLSQDAYAKSVEPFFEALRSLDLTARGVKASPQNFQRSAEVGQTLHATKLALRK